MDKTTSVLLAGVGGQGVLLVGQIIARAAMLSGLDVKMNEVHGMAQRGGSVLAQVRYGKKVNGPIAWEGQADLIISLERIEALRYARCLSPRGRAICSEEAVIPVTVSSGKAEYPANAHELAAAAFAAVRYIDAVGIAEALGNRKAANVVLAGAASKGLSLPESAWLGAIRELVQEKYRELNVKAFEAGRQAV
jgi:indolepyruvate ferredoxin oxidoreductase, beta subunit